MKMKHVAINLCMNSVSKTSLTSIEFRLGNLEYLLNPYQRLSQIDPFDLFVEVHCFSKFLFTPPFSREKPFFLCTIFCGHRWKKHIFFPSFSSQRKKCFKNFLLFVLECFLFALLKHCWVVSEDDVEWISRVLLQIKNSDGNFGKHFF